MGLGISLKPYESKIQTGTESPEGSEIVFQANVQIKCDRRFWEFNHAFNLLFPNVLSHLLFIRIYSQILPECFKNKPPLQTHSWTLYVNILYLTNAQLSFHLCLEHFVHISSWLTPQLHDIWAQRPPALRYLSWRLFLKQPHTTSCFPLFLYSIYQYLALFIFFYLICIFHIKI